MARIAFILLCHKDPDGVIAQVGALTQRGDCVAIHFDRGGKKEDFARIQSAFEGRDDVVFAARVRCGWGEWSLVQGTLNGLRAAHAAFSQATHFYLISGDCLPIKSAAHVHAALDAEDADYIESVDFFTSGWIRTGFVEERLVYRHVFNERRQKAVYYASIDLQRRLGLRRALPDGIKIHIGSQWWCLRRGTVGRIFDMMKARPGLVRFFRTTWIPDETFFQTLVHATVPRSEIRSEPPTFLMFSDYGMPVNFYNDHHGFLLGQRQFFARKISPEATALKSRLRTLYSNDDARFEIVDDGKKVFDFVTGKGRHGERYGPPAWTARNRIGHGRRLLILVSKKWHVARRLAGRIGLATNVTCLDFVFDEEHAELPSLGGIAATRVRRRRHPQMLMALLFEHFGTDRMVVCVDPSNLSLLRDLDADPCETAVLELDADLDADWLAGHAGRLGLLGPASDARTAKRVLPALAGAVAGELAALRGAGLSGYDRIRQGADETEIGRALGGFLRLPETAAREIARNEDLFAD